MKLAQFELTFQEIPDEVCLTLLISGCKLACKGCHSKYAWSEEYGIELNSHMMSVLLERYKAAITCVVFLGGEWHKSELIQLLQICQNKGVSTALYTGLDNVDQEIQNNLNFLKTGKWSAELGGLDSPTTNQKLIKLDTNEILLPRPKEGHHDSTR
jgi:anaerobic ribonucleoside-triphosphate reductase activating protein